MEEKISKLAKIGISQEADQSIDRVLAKVNDGFSGGRVTKSDLASWIAIHFETHALEDNLEKIRKDHFDQIAYLECVLKEVKQAKKSGTTAPDLISLLAPVTNKGTQRKRSLSDPPIN